MKTLFVNYWFTFILGMNITVRLEQVAEVLTLSTDTSSCLNWVRTWQGCYLKNKAITITHCDYSHGKAAKTKNKMCVVRMSILFIFTVNYQVRLQQKKKCSYCKTLNNQKQNKQGSSFIIVNEMLRSWSGDTFHATPPICIWYEKQSLNFLTQCLLLYSQPADDDSNYLNGLSGT